jgi:hypothetical protein
MTLKGIMGLQSLPLLFASWIMKREWSVVIGCPCQKSNAKEPLYLVLKHPEPGPQNNPFLFVSLLPRVFSYSDEKMNNIVSARQRWEKERTASWMPTSCPGSHVNTFIDNYSVGSHLTLPSPWMYLVPTQPVGKHRTWTALSPPTPDGDNSKSQETTVWGMISLGMVQAVQQHHLPPRPGMEKHLPSMSGSLFTRWEEN